MAVLYAAEVRRWSSALHWDTRGNWLEVESARSGGRLSGLIARDTAGRICGWMFYLLHNGALEIGALQSTSRETTGALIDHAQASSEGQCASSVVLFAYSDAPGLVAALRTRGFAVEQYLYLSVALHGASTPGRGRQRAPAVIRPYEHADAAGVADLFAAAYAHADPVRPFVRSDAPGEWATYVGHLVATAGCGALLPAASFVVPAAGAPRLDGVTLVTSLAADTSHFAQIAVRPERQGEGIARRLIGASLVAARRQGFTRATLLVGEANVRARGLYGRLGFEAVAGFVSAVCDQPRRSRSAALEIGGTMTLR
jgi:ribosomal protein S18 acetylase RimI-like enzyme